MDLVNTIGNLILQTEGGTVPHFFYEKGWQNLLCLALGVFTLYQGYTGKAFRSYRSSEPISVFRGKLLSYIIGVGFILLGLFGRNWHY